jgi:hypothetical protein
MAWPALCLVPLVAVGIPPTGQESAFGHTTGGLAPKNEDRLSPCPAGRAVRFGRRAGGSGGRAAWRPEAFVIKSMFIWLVVAIPWSLSAIQEMVVCLNDISVPEVRLQRQSATSKDKCARPSSERCCAAVNCL